MRMIRSIRIIRCTARHLDRMLDYVSAHNPDSRRHIGYFGVTPGDIRHTVRTLDLRYDRGFRLALEGQQLVGVMGVDFDREIGRAWLYGPIVTTEDWSTIADSLYAEVQKAIPAQIGEHEMFCDAENVDCRGFAQRHGFAFLMDVAIFYITPDRLAVLPEATADEWDGRFADPFVALHNRLFPNSNYTLAYMLSEHEKGGPFLTLSDDGRLAGYFFGRADAESGEAYVDLVGVDEACRGSGLGRRLMLAGLARLRQTPGLRQVNLTVASGNAAARRLYHSLGFAVEREMVAFRKRVHEEA
jgi:ribosomal protein S18 acetylase RimI-like enzyme